MPGRWSVILALAAAVALATAGTAWATAPYCIITGPTSVNANTPAPYSGTESYDPDNCPGGGCSPGEGIVSYVWDFGEDVTDLLVNGGFEGDWQEYPGSDWIGEGWTRWQGLRDPQFDADSSIRHSGGFSQQVSWTAATADDGPFEAGIYQTYDGLTVGALYALEMWVRASGPMVSNMTGFVGYDPTGGTTPDTVPSQNWRSVQRGAGWGSGTWVFAATGPAVTIWFRWRNQTPVAGTFEGWADDAKLWQVTSASEVCHVFPEPFTTYTVGLTVVDDDGEVSTCPPLTVTTTDSPSQPPTCNITHEPASPVRDQDVTFNANAIDPEGGGLAQWYWDFGDGTAVVGSLCDGTPGAGDPITHRYTAYGTYQVTCWVVDDTGAVGLCQISVVVKNTPPVCQWTAVSASPAFRKVQVDASASYDPDGSIVSYIWDFGDGGTLTEGLVANPGFDEGPKGLPVVGWTEYPLNEPDFGQNDRAEGTTDLCNIYSEPFDMYTYICPHSGPRYLFAFSEWTEKNYGYYQTVTGLIPGAGYTATVYHANFNNNGWPSAGDRIGVDPESGTDRTAPSAVWSSWQSTANATEPPGGWWPISVSFVAQQNRTATIFLELRQICTSCSPLSQGTACWMNALDDVTLSITGASGATAWYIFETPGTYGVCLTLVDNEGAIAKCCKSIYIGSPASEVPTCAITYSPADPTEEDTVYFQSNASDSDGTLVSWEWDFGDGGAANGDPVSHRYDAQGIYTVSCTITDDTATAKTCRATLTLRNAPPTCAIDAPTLAAPGEEIEFRDASDDGMGAIVSAVWDFGDPAAPQPPDLTVANPSFEDATAWTLYRGGPISNYFEFCDFAPRNGAKFFGRAADGSSIEGGAYQTLTDAVAGNTYRAGVWVATRGWNPTGPSYPEDVICRIGVDPTGGTDPDSSRVDWAQISNDGCPPPYVLLSVDFLALASTCTVFVEFYNALPRRNQWNIVAMDDVSVAGLYTGAYGSPVYYTYGSDGAYLVTLTVTDDDGASSTCTHTVEVSDTVEVSLTLDTAGWHMISLPLEPVNKSILLDRATKQVDPDSIFYTAWQQGNDPRNRLFRYDPVMMSYWAYNPALYPAQSWYEIGIDDGNPDTPYPGPWWQGFWFSVEPVELPLTITYTAYASPPEPRQLDIAGRAWSWLMTGGFGRPPSPYDPDTRNWPATAMATEVFFGESAAGPWLPTSDCDDESDDAYHLGWIGLPLVGYTSGVGYYGVSPSQGQYCGAQAAGDSLYAGEGYWLDVENPDIWLLVDPAPW